MTLPNGSPKQHGSKINIIKRLDTKNNLYVQVRSTRSDMRISSFSTHLMQCWYVYLSMRHKKCLQTHHHVSAPTFVVDILLFLLYSNIYKGIRRFVFVSWMQRQCPVLQFRASALKNNFCLPLSPSPLFTAANVLPLKRTHQKEDPSGRAPPVEETKEIV